MFPKRIKYKNKLKSQLNFYIPAKSTWKQLKRRYLLQYQRISNTLRINITKDMQEIYRGIMKDTLNTKSPK